MPTSRAVARDSIALLKPHDLSQTFDVYHGSTSLYLFVFARTVNDMHYKWIAVPPFNLLSIPYLLCRR
jgi:hypothetical protein